MLTALEKPQCGSSVPQGEACVPLLASHEVISNPSG